MNEANDERTRLLSLYVSPFKKKVTKDLVMGGEVRESEREGERERKWNRTNAERTFTLSGRQRSRQQHLNTRDVGWWVGGGVSERGGAGR